MPLTLSEAGKALRDLGGNISKDALIPALQAIVQPVEFSVRDRYRATTIAHHLAGQYLTGRHRQAKRLKLRAPLAKGVFVSVYTREQYAASPALRVVFYGLAALMEEGGRTKAHPIEANAEFAGTLKKKSRGVFGGGARALALPNGFAAKVMHPGSQFKRYGIAELVLNQFAPRVEADIARRLVDAISRARLAA